jgi:hypothetical protein
VPPSKAYWSKDDAVFLEDESGRAKLLGLDNKAFVAGRMARE